jgi:tRNA (guanine-N7-)-methyltransferase
MKARYLSLAPFICWRTMERPVPWAQVFGRQAPLEVEIGFGNGEFLIRQAQHHPERDFVGIDLEWASVQRGLRRIAQAKIPNVRLLQADAHVMFERVFAPGTLQRVYALFPCPWPKERHTHRRLFSHAFIRLVNSRLIETGEVQIVTDSSPFAQWVETQVPGTGFTLRSEPIPPRFRTKYERKWRAQGQESFYQVQLTKHQHTPIPLREDVPVQTHRIEHFDPEHFCPANARGAITVKFKDFLYDPRRRCGMVWVFTVEAGMTQDFWIQIVWKRDCWHIRPAPGCAVIPTVSVQQALDRVRDAAQDGAEQSLRNA